MSTLPKILYIDDEEDLVSLAETFFEDENLPIETSTTFYDAVEKIKKQSYDLIISDARMPTGSGQELLELIRKDGFVGKFILVTGNTDNHQTDSGPSFDLVIYKPLKFKELIDEVKKILSMKL